MNNENTSLKITYEIEGIKIEVKLPDVSPRELAQRLVRVSKFIKEAQKEFSNQK